MRRTIFYVSDGTGITAETIGHSVLTQFDGIDFDTFRLPFVDNEEKAHGAAARISNIYTTSGARPIVVNTVIDPPLTEILATSGALMIDVFAPFIGPLEDELGTKRSPRVGKAHGLTNFAEYEARINATNYALSHDDGVDVNYGDAEVILVGVSRVGKTPTCLYMALHYGVKAANYPLTEEDLEKLELPKRLVPYKAASVRIDHRAATPRAGARSAQAGQPLRETRSVQARTRNRRQTVQAREHSGAEHDVDIDRGNREQDPSAARHRKAHVLSRSSGAAARPGRRPVPNGGFASQITGIIAKNRIAHRMNTSLTELVSASRVTTFSIAAQARLRRAHRSRVKLLM